MKVVLLAGGKGTRLSEETALRPKPMVQVGGIPILEHIMRSYSAYGHDEFLVACGHLGHVIKEYFSSYRSRHADFTVELGSGRTSFHDVKVDNWSVTLVDTGPETMTGGRLARLQHHLADDTFMMTYGDGLANIDIDALIAHHRSHGRLATVSAVRPPARFGSLVLDGESNVTAFEEKISTSEALINGGFFVLEPGVFEYVGDDEMPFEREPMERLAADGQLSAFVHEGFWKPMDTLRDKIELEDLWTSGAPPWLPEHRT